MALWEGLLNEGDVPRVIVFVRQRPHDKLASVRH